MSEWYQAFLVLFLVFPAVLMVGVFRIFYSTSRFVQVNNFFLLLPSVIVGFWLNIDLLYKVLSLADVENKIFNQSIWPILIWVNLRAMGLISVLAIVHRLLEFINDWGGEKREPNKQNKNFVVKCLFCLLEKLEILLLKFHKLVSHPWVGYIRHNQRIEILIADIFTEDGNLYMGRFISFQEDGNEASMIAISNNFRFYPSTNNNENVEEGSHVKRNPDGVGYVSKRKQRLINNSGHLLIPYSKIRTIHLWKLKKGTDMALNIFDTNSEESFRWYLSLMKSAPQIFTTFKIKVFLNNENKEDFERRLLTWTKEYAMPEEVLKKILITYIK